MKILLATGGPTIPQMIGGSQRSGDTLLKRLAERGHDVALTSALIGNGLIGWRARLLMKLTGRRAVTDNNQGYPIYRSWFPHETAAEVAKHFRPDVVIVQAHKTGLVAQAFHRLNLPILFSFQDVEFNEHGFDIGGLGPLQGVANSQFTAAAYREKFRADCSVIHPLIDPGQYLVEETGGNVVFINPSRVKGLDIALEVAALLPDIPFIFQEAWPLTPEERASLNKRIENLDNITLRPTTQDMRDVYREARILLCPSQWNEGYGRIASEAQFSGIPVVGSDRGGLPEAIGDGGVVISHEAHASVWADQIRELWTNKEKYKSLRESALTYSRREALSLDRQIDAWECAIEKAHRNHFTA
ncbi:glycosyltransferase [Aurantiacibacter flavus]|uniref:Glycosyltransferase n=1 Tax=Aurantiacibacter flavus TaxID=3145232 RepID=A0ABV0CTN9_9SPHN